MMLSEDAPEIRQQLAAAGVNGGAAADEAFDRGETARLVQVALDLLPGSYSEVLEWKYIYGLSGGRDRRAHEHGPEGRRVAARPRPEVVPPGVLGPGAWAGGL